MAVFISYSKEDLGFAERAERRLREEGHIVDRDQDTMRFGGNWRTEVLPHVDSCDAFLLIWSAAANRSAPVHEEIGRALHHERHIVTVLLDETPVPGTIADIQYFPVELDLSGFDEVLRAVTPRSRHGAQTKLADRLAAANTLLARTRRRFGSFQVLYPGDNRPTEEAISLRLVEGAYEDSGSDRDSSIQELLSVLGPSEHIVLLGHPGSGKTTTLLLGAHQIAMRGDPEDLPVYLRCKDYKPGKHSSMKEFVIDSIRQEAGDEVAEIAADGSLSTFGIQTLLVDGLDELLPGTSEEFQRILSEFGESEDGSAVRIILSTRVDTFRALDVDSDWFKGWRRFRLRPLAWERIEGFARQWFPADSDADKFLREVEDPRMIELAERPFLLAMMCLVFEKDGELGANRSDLYRRAIGFLESRRGDQASEHILELRAKVLRELALRGLQTGSVELNRWLAAGVAASELNGGDRAMATSFDKAFAFLDEAARDVGVLQATSLGYSFLHRSFQEYLAAAKLGSMPEGEGVLIEHCRVPGWEEPIRLHVGALRGVELQLSFLRKLWQHNQGLALRALTELGRASSTVIAQLLADSTAADRVRMLHEVRASLDNVDAATRRRLVIETTAPLLDADQDSEVLYWAIVMLKEVDPDDSAGVLWKAFGRHAESLLSTLTGDPGYRFELLAVDGGQFTMGDDTAQDDIEKPAHPVRLSPFQIGRWQLTNLAYEHITGKSSSDRPEYAREDQHPVVDLSWFDAYIAAMRVGCRLPTEAEWEFATRGGTDTQWSHGDEEDGLDRFANYEGNPVTKGTPWPVGSGEPNPFGLYDMHGNVWEWCQDWLEPYPQGSVENPNGAPAGSQRVRRGGGHAYHARGCRSAFRWGNDPGYRFKDIGVRFASDSRAVKS